MRKHDKVTAFLGKGTEFEGKLTFHGSTRIDGHFKGEISADGDLIVSESGLLEADIHASHIVISGEIHGNITADRRVDIHAPAKVFGDIKAPSVVIDEGVIFEGRTRMNRPPEVEETESSVPGPVGSQLFLSTLSGKVTDQATGHPIPHAKIKCKGDSKKHTETDASGYYEFSNLRDGTWELKIKTKGYGKNEAQVEIIGPGTFEENVTLEPKK